MKRRCNKCGKEVDVRLMVKCKKYKYGIRPECLACRAIESAERRRKKGLKISDYKPRPKRRIDPERIEAHKKAKDKRKKAKDNALKILIKNGFARNEEEARKYIGL